MESHYVYVLAYPDGRVFYVGKGTGRRIHQHEPEARRGVQSHKCNVIRKIWREGGEIVKVIIARFATHEEAIQYEIALIFFMDSLSNRTDGGDGVVGLTRTAEHNRAISEATKGRLAPNQGKPQSEETRRKISDAHRGRKRPGMNKGRVMSSETRRKIAEAHRGHPEPPMSEETRRKLSKALRGNTWNTRKTHCPHGHPYEGENLVIEKKEDGRLKRKCRACRNAAFKAYHAKRKQGAS